MFAEAIHWLRERGGEANYRDLLKYCISLYGPEGRMHLDRMFELYPEVFIVIQASTSRIDPRPRRVRLLWDRDGFSRAYGVGLIKRKEVEGNG